MSFYETQSTGIKWKDIIMLIVLLIICQQRFIQYVFKICTEILRIDDVKIIGKTPF